MPQRGRASRPERNEPRSALFLPVAVVLSIWVIFGGAAPESVLPFALLGVSGTVLLALVVSPLGAGTWAALSWPARLMVLFFCLMPVLQLVPLPPAIWHALPGRSLAVETLSAAGVADEWRPLTLAFAPTFRTALVFLWLAALLLATLQLSSTELRRIFLLLLALGLLNVAIGVVQVVSNNTLLVFYQGFAGRFLTGLFANKNHTGLFIAMTFLFGYAALYGKQGWERRNLAMVISIGMVLFIALLATFSRAGLVFGLGAIVFLVVLSSGSRLRSGVRALLIAVPLVVAGLFAVVASTDLASQAVARFGSVGEDLRWSIWEWSWPLVGRYFPAGSGIGSFTAIYPSHEQLDWVMAVYVNHVHNDYLEQLIEVGVAAPIAWALVLLALWRPVLRAWEERGTQSGRLALMGAAAVFLIAVHSAFDYPLRRPAIAAAAMVALASVLRIEGRRRLRGARGYATQEA
jgi:O-antigen ligase